VPVAHEAATSFRVRFNATAFIDIYNYKMSDSFSAVGHNKVIDPLL